MSIIQNTSGPFPSMGDPNGAQSVRKPAQPAKETGLPSGFGPGVPGDEAQYAKPLPNGFMPTVGIEGLDDFLGQVQGNQVQVALEKVDRMLDVKHKLHPRMSLTDLSNLSEEVASLRLELTRTMHRMSTDELNQFARELGNLMARTDGDDDFLNTLLQQTLDLAQKPRLEPFPNFPDRIEPHWRRKWNPYVLD